MPAQVGAPVVERDGAEQLVDALVELGLADDDVLDIVDIDRG